MTTSRSMSALARLFSAIRRRPFRSALAALAILVVLMLGAAMALMYSEPGRALIARSLERALSTPGEMEIEIGRLSGPLPGRMRIDRLTVRDSQGDWLTSRDLAVRWSPLALLQGRLQIDDIRAGEIALLRKPAPPQTDTPAADEGTGLSLPPLEVALENLIVQKLRLHEPVLGQAAALRLQGDAAALRDRAVVNLAVERLDEMDGRAHVTLDWNAATGSLDIDAALSEPSDGLVARLLDLPQRPPLDLTVAGEGPAGNWRGEIDLEAGELLALQSSLTVVVDRGIRVTMKGSGEPGDAFREDVATILGPSTAFDLEVGHEFGGDVWSIAINEIASDAVKANGRAIVSTDDARIDGKLAIETAGSSRLARIAEPATFASATADLTFKGPLTYPAVDLDSVMQGLSVEGFSAERAEMHVALRPAGPLDADDAMLNADGEVKLARLRTPSAEANGLLGETTRLAFESARLQGYQNLHVAEASLATGQIEISATGDLGLDNGVLNASGQAAVGDLAVLSDIATRPLSGEMRTDFGLTRVEDGVVRLNLDGTLRNVMLDQEIAERLLGPTAKFTGSLRRRPDGMVSLSDFALTGQGARFKGNLSVDPDSQHVEADYDVVASDLDALGIADPNRGDGTLQISGKASGPATDPRFVGSLQLTAGATGGIRVARLEAQYTASGLAGAPHGSIEVNGETDLLPDIDGRTEFELTEDRLALSKLSLSARKTTVDGQLSIPLRGMAIEGALRVRSPDIGGWSDLTGTPLAGKLDGSVALSKEGQRQDAALDARISGFAVDGRLTARQVDLDMRVTDLAGSPGLEGSVSAGKAQAGQVSLKELSLNLDGSVKQLGYELHADGGIGQRELTLDAKGRFGQGGDRTTLLVTSLSGKVADVPIRLRSPISAEVAPSIESGQIDLAVGEGAVKGRYTQSGGKVSMQADLQALPLASVWPAAPPQLAGSVLDANASLDGPAAQPTGTLDLSVTGLAAGETSEISEGLTLVAKGELAGGELTANGRVDGLAGVTSRLQLSLPARLSLEPAAFAIDERRPVRGSMSYVGPVEPGWALLGMDRHRLEGEGDMNIELSGTPADPSISGRVELTDGRYENLDTGTILTDMQVVALPSQSTLTIDKATAKDGDGGEISVDGKLEFGGDDIVSMDIRADFREAMLVRRDELTARSSGQITLRGNETRRRISGSIEVEEAEVRLVGGSPPGVVEIQVEEKGTPPPGAIGATPETKPSKTELDIRISMPGRVFVRGRGLDSEWAGNLTVTGTTASPRIQGELHPVRGQYDFAGKIFKLRKGSIQFVGKDEVNPILDLSAERQATDITAIIHVTGTAKKPVVSLESVPEYPQDEVLSRVLFNKSTGRLSAGEAVQLAQAVRTLTGASDGGGIMDFARGMLNLDVLRFGGGGEDGESGAEAGKYINDRIYLGVEGNAAGDTGVTVEVEITPRLKLESDVGSGDKSQTGLKWKRDY